MAVNRVRRLLLTSAVLALTLLLFPAPVLVQAPTSGDAAAGPSGDWSQDVPAHFAVVNGQVSLVRDGRLEPAEANQLVLAGDRLRTEDGRVQILFPDGSALAVDQNTTLDLLSDSLVRLIGGRLRLTLSRTTEGLDYRVDTAAGFAEIRSAGEYRVQTAADRRGKLEVELIVYRGTAELANDFGRTAVRAGYHAVTSADTEPSLPYTSNSAAWDDFDQWVDGLTTAHVVSVSSPSAGYLPEEERYYATTLDTYGAWDYLAPYGAVWYPRVNAGWRPYWQGRWSYTGHYGWNWLGIDYWAWPTFHYGRWGVSGVGWYWIPDRHWGPAWVSWGGSPGYVGWAPLGYGGYPGAGFGVATPYYADAWSVWTVMPMQAWTHNVWVTDHRMRGDAMPPGARNGFGHRGGGPPPMGSDAPRREIAPIGRPTAPRDVAGPRPVNVANGADAGRAGRTSGATAGFPLPIPGSAGVPQSRDAIPRVQANDRGGSMDGFPATRAFPQTRTGMPSAVPSARAGSTSGGRRTDVNSSAPTRAMPRQGDPAPYQPSMGADSSSPARRTAEPNRAAPRSNQPYQGPVDRSRGIERSAPPSGFSSPPPASSAPRRGPSAQPPAAASAPPPARGRSVAPSAPAPAPPAASPGRGGGSSGAQSSGRGAAVPRRGGGRG